MSPRWESNSYLKIHEHCGGMVRWVEAYDDPHTGYTGECLECGQDRVVVEDILPFELPEGLACVEAYDRFDRDDLCSFEWDYSDEYSAQQQELRELMDA